MTAEQAEKIAKHPNVISVEEDVVVNPTETQTGATWGIDRIDQRALPLDTNYSYIGNGTGVTAYIIDSGINYEHEDFGGRASLVYDIINDGSKDCSGHGTHIAGTIGSTTYGVAKNVTLKGVKVACGSVGVGNYIAGLDWVAANATGLSVANMSANTTVVSKALNNAVNGLSRKNVTVVVSAGNSSMNACNTSPASASGAITVGAMGGSTSGADLWWAGSNNGSCVDLIAPGIAIVSLSHADNVSTRVMGGTSMAAPHVAGVAVLYRQANPSVAGKDVINGLVSAATMNAVGNVPAGTPNRLLYNNW
jgi:subtilisin family serine protease